MAKKLIVGMMFLGGIVFFSTGFVFASEEETKPYESMTRFRGEDSFSAQEMDISKEDFHVYRNETRDQHRQSRLEEREERLMAAVERGCITEDEMLERMQIRKGRFSK